MKTCLTVHKNIFLRVNIRHYLNTSFEGIRLKVVFEKERNQSVEVVEFSMGSYGPMENSEYMKALVNGKCKVYGNFDTEVDVANLLA